MDTAIKDLREQRLRTAEHPSPPQSIPYEDPLKTLQMRFVRSEITAQQYEEMKKMLSG